ncbi:hypothetical protein [Micavibrio aeruginosavorus]|uniref:hypothetical protein n=1 Tax=Micavibrio aeruginosavorus TaxID=349221 RepID=UPI003F4AE122
MAKPNLRTWNGRIEWLRAQARASFHADGMVNHDAIWQPKNDVPTTRYATLSDAFNALNQLAPTFCNLSGNLAVRAWAPMAIVVQDRMTEFVADHGYTDLSYLGNGGRAVAFRARHMASGEMRVVRVEGDHNCRQLRPVHPTVLQAFASNQNMLADFDQVRIEMLPEVVPLTRMPERVVSQDGRAYTNAILDLSWGTNKAYPRDWFDYDAEPQNVGIVPTGQVVTFDPEIFIDADAVQRRREFDRHYRTPRAGHLVALYGVTP